MKTPQQHIYYFLYKIGRLKKYVGFSEAAWERYVADYHASLGDDELNIAAFGGSRDLSADLSNAFPQYHRRASFLMLFALFEDDLNRLCEAIAADRKLNSPQPGTKERGIERSKIWLKDVAGIDIAGTHEWVTIVELREVRNVLIHAAGFLNPANSKHERMRKMAERATSRYELHYHARTELTLRSGFLDVAIDSFAAIYQTLNRLI